jgi:hypothetical protein
MPTVQEQLRRYADDVAGPPRHPHESREAEAQARLSSPKRGRLALVAALVLFIGAAGYMLLSPRSASAPSTATEPTSTITAAPVDRPIRAVQELDLTNLGTACNASGLCVEAQGSPPAISISASVNGAGVGGFTTDECTRTNAPFMTSGTSQLTSGGGEIFLTVPTDAPEIVLDGVSMTQVVVMLPADTKLQLAYATVNAADDSELLAAADSITKEFSRYERPGSRPTCTPTFPPR